MPNPKVPANAPATPILNCATLQWAVSTNGGRSGYNASIGTLALGNGHEPQPVAAFTNPAGSGIDVHLDRLAACSTTAGTWQRYRGATITPTGAPAPNINRGGGDTEAKAQLYPASAITIDGGVPSKVMFTQPRLNIDGNFAGNLILRPGQTLHWRFQPEPAGHNPGPRVTIEIVWWEEPAG